MCYYYLKNRTQSILIQILKHSRKTLCENSAQQIIYEQIKLWDVNIKIRRHRVSKSISECTTKIKELEVARYKRIRTVNEGVLKWINLIGKWFTA